MLELRRTKWSDPYVKTEYQVFSIEIGQAEDLKLTGSMQ